MIKSDINLANISAFSAQIFFKWTKKKSNKFFSLFQVIAFSWAKMFQGYNLNHFCFFVFLPFSWNWKGREGPERHGKCVSRTKHNLNHFFFFFFFFFFFAPKVSNSERLRAKTETDRPNKFFTFFFLFKLTLSRILLGLFMTALILSKLAKIDFYDKVSFDMYIGSIHFVFRNSKHLNLV